MTRLPTELRDVHGIEGPDYTLNVVCAAPGCPQRAEERHHLWRRSEIGGDFSWVVSEAWGSVPLANLVGLCRDHHAQITINAARISYDPAAREFTWITILGGEHPLEWTPPLPEDFEAPVEASGNGEVAQEITICPSCKRPLPHPRHDGPMEQKRPRRTWSLTVPRDERENGAQMLDDLLEASREELASAGLPYGAEDTVKYFVLATTLALFVRHAKEVLG